MEPRCSPQSRNNSASGSRLDRRRSPSWSSSRPSGRRRSSAMNVRTLSIAAALTAFAAHAAAQSQTSPTQTGAPPGRLTFEVASIKRNVSGDPGASIRIQPGGQMTVTNNSLFNLIRNAYGSQRYEMVPGPKLQTWVDSERWDILAKPPAGAPEVQELSLIHI